MDDKLLSGSGACVPVGGQHICSGAASAHDPPNFPDPLVVLRVCFPRAFAGFAAAGASGWAASIAAARRPNPMFFARSERAAA